MTTIVVYMSVLQAQNWTQLAYFLTGTMEIPTINSMVEYNGDLYIGGHFASGGGIVASNIARWNGTSWSALNSGCDGKVNALAVYNGELYVGGDFGITGGISSPYMAKWNGSTWSEVSFYNHKVKSLIVNNNDLIVATSDSYTAYNMYEWDGSNWTHFGGTYKVRADQLCVHDNELYVAGVFNDTSLTNNDFYGIAKWDGSGWIDITGVTGGTSNNYMTASLVSYNGCLYLSGNYIYSLGGITIDNIAKWDGVSWSNVPLGSSSTSMSCLFSHSTGLYFSCVENEGYRKVVKWNGTSWTPISQGGISLDVWIFLYYNSKLFTVNGSSSGHSTVNFITPSSSDVESNELLNFVEIYPNPSNDLINIGATSNIDEIKVYNELGQLLYSSTPKIKKVSIKLEGKGVFIIKITCGKQTGIKKIVLD